MARDNKGFKCHNHKHHVSYEDHHVWPKEFHGPSIPSNMIRICPNAHSDIHDLMNKMLRGKPYNWKEYGPNVRKYAVSGYKQVMAYAKELSRQIEGKV